MPSTPDKNWNKLDWIQPSSAIDGPADSRLVYAYRPRPIALILGILFFGMCGLFLAREAMTNQRGLIINGIIHLSVDGATIFYECLSGASFVFVAILLLMFPLVFIGHQVVIDESSITLPNRGLSTGHRRIEFRDIRRIGISRQQYRRRTFTTVRIYHLEGMRAIRSNFLPRDTDIDAIVRILEKQVPANGDQATACRQCGYNLRGNASGNCPECGRKL